LLEVFVVGHSWVRLSVPRLDFVRLGTDHMGNHHLGEPHRYAFVLNSNLQVKHDTGNKLKAVRSV